MNQSKIFWDNAAKDPDVRYKYIADEWASTETFLNLIESNNSNWNNVLEIGCGIGRLLDPLSEKYNECNFYAIDISDEMINLAPKKDNIKYQEFVNNPYGLTRWKGLINYMESEDWSNKIPTLLDYLTTTDSVRGTCYTDIFPELKNL